MASLTNYAEDKLRDHLLGITAYTMPTDVYLALYTAAPDETGGGTECTGGSYARQVISTWTAGSTGSGSASNSADLSFTNMPACTVVAVALLDAASGGNMLLYETLGSSKTVTAGATLPVATGDVVVTFA